VSTTISIIGRVGVFLLGMTVMTAGLKGLAGSDFGKLIVDETENGAR
jgi:Na+/phosphate symporter